MSFSDDVRKFAEEARRKQQAAFVGCVVEVHGSVTDGSALTGAPGQPVDTANLKNSFGPEFPEPLIGEVITNVAYAPAIEDGEVQPHTRQSHERTSVLGNVHTVRAHEVQGYTFRQPYRGGGGPHSVKLTRAAWPQIVDHVVRGVTG